MRPLSFFFFHFLAWFSRVLYLGILLLLLLFCHLLVAVQAAVGCISFSKKSDVFLWARGLVSSPSLRSASGKKKNGEPLFCSARLKNMVRIERENCILHHSGAKLEENDVSLAHYYPPKVPPFREIRT